MKSIWTFLKFLFTENPTARFKSLNGIVRFLWPEYRLTSATHDWLNYLPFSKYADKHRLWNPHIDNRLMLYQLIRLASNVEGDTAECGVYTGESSYMICKMNEQNNLLNKTHHIFDSFEGLSNPSEKDGTHWKAGDLKCEMQTVKDTLEHFDDRVLFYKGWIPEKFTNVANTRFSFVHIDVDLYKPTLESIKFFYPRLSEGGLILCDDYGYTTCPGATEAVDEFLKDKKEKMISLSSGGGFLIKGTQTQEQLYCEAPI